MTSGTKPARALLAIEGGDVTASPETVAAAVERVWTQLARRFARLIGGGGIRALQERSMSVVAVRLTWMTPPKQGVGEDWKELQIAFEGRSAAEGVAGFEELFTTLIALLGRFIGEALVGHVLHEMWPGVFPGDAKERM